METTQEPLRGIAIVRKLIEVKEREQEASREAFRTDPEIRAIYEKLKEANAGRRATK